jgi:hypothetical protein
MGRAGVLSFHPAIRRSIGLTDLQFSRARPSARGCATRSVAQNEAARPPGQREYARLWPLSTFHIHSKACR